MEKINGENTEREHESVVFSLHTDAWGYPKAPSFTVLLICHDSQLCEKDNLYLFDWIRKDTYNTKIITAGSISWITTIGKRKNRRGKLITQIYQSSTSLIWSASK